MLLFIACAAQFMVVLDVSAVNVALPSMRASLGFTDGGLHWVVNAYVLTFAGFLLAGGRAADLFGRKRVFRTGLALFTAASLAGGLAGTDTVLVVARAAQGLGAAALAPATLTLLTATHQEGPRRTRMLAVWAAVAMVAGASGSVVGGLLTDYLSWRWILLVNVPLGIAGLIAATRVLPDDERTERRRHLDLPGAALATAGLAATTYGVSTIGTHGWATPLLIAGVGALAAFAVYENRFARAPLIPSRLLRSRTVSLGNVVMFLTGACLNPMWYFLTLYLQEVLHYGPLRAGLGFLPLAAVSAVVGARVTPWLMRRADSRLLIIAGAVAGCAGFVWQSAVTPQDGYASGVLGPVLVLAVGLGLLNAPITATATAGVDRADAGAASGLMNTTKQVGGALGLAGLIAVCGTSYTTAFLIMAALLAGTAVVATALPSTVHTRADVPSSRTLGERDATRPR
ncbi:MFS transporter [Herbihabitans rhizosphaerae]|uniref:MFS transporter n=1 Tax=Herbihabitans rhizosphaerae TaxID=1872711 RepID=UPI001F5E6E8E|nr:MFS transporter [Herbihabitans rhizosphaerae]